MATIDKKLIHFERLADFEARLAAGDILNHSIVWIKDAKKIWTHGEFYAGSTLDLSGYLTSEEIAELYASKDSLAEVAFSGSYNNLTDKPDIPAEVAESTVSGWGFTKNTGTVTGVKMNGVSKGTSGVVDLGTVITEHQDISTKQDVINDLAAIRSGAAKGATALQAVPSEYITETELSGKGYATTSSVNSGLASKQDVISDLETIRSGAAKGATALQSYTEKYTGTYSKPSTGIPKTDLASAVQTSLGKADTALQSYTETDPVFSASAAAGIKASDITNWNSKTSNTGTVTGVKMNGTTKSPSSGVVDLGTVITSHQDISGKLDSSTAASTYITKADAASTYLGKTAKAASATTADSATKATKDGGGNTITSTYATKTELGGVQTQIDTLVSGDASSAIESFNEITAFLAGVEDTGTLDGIIAGINTEIAKKADKSSAITGISRSGTTFTATRADGTSFTFTQQDNNTTYTFAGGTNKFTVTPSGGTAQTVTVTPSISNNVTYSGTLTSGQVAVLDGTAGKIKASGYTIAASVPSGAKFTDTTYSAATTDANGLMTSAMVTKLNGIATGATAVSSSTVSGWGFTKNAGTVTGIKMNGASKGTSGVVDLGTVITAHQDISGKQDKLVSGTSIKTINGTSLLGAGNIGMIWATATNGVDYPSVTIN